MYKSQNHQSRIIQQEVPRTYRTEIPNIVFEKLEGKSLIQIDSETSHAITIVDVDGGQ